MGRIYQPMITGTGNGGTITGEDLAADETDGNLFSRDVCFEFRLERLASRLKRFVALLTPSSQMSAY